MGSAAATPQMKSQIELFVGNIPVGTTQQGLVDFLNAAMLKVGGLLFHLARNTAAACAADVASRQYNLLQPHGVG